MPARLINIKYITIRAEKVASPVTALQGEARHFKFGVPIDVDECYHTCDGLSTQGMYLGSCDFFSLWKVTDNILETAQDRYIDTNHTVEH